MPYYYADELKAWKWEKEVSCNGRGSGKEHDIWNGGGGGEEACDSQQT